MRQGMIAVAIAIGALAALLGLWVQHHVPEQKHLELLSGTILSQPRTLLPFELKDEAGRLFTLQNLQGHWSLIVVGRFQPCPPTLSTLQQVYQKLAAAKQKPMPQWIFIADNPQNDTNQRWCEYLNEFDPHFIGVVGNSSFFSQLMIGAQFFKTDQASQSIALSDVIFVIDPEAQLYAIFSVPNDATNIAIDMADIMRHYRRS